MADGIYIAIGIVGIILFVLHNYKLTKKYNLTKKRQDTEKIFLKKYELTRLEIVYDPELCVPSGDSGIGRPKDLVVPKNELNLVIFSSKFLRPYPEMMGWDTTRIFSFSSSKGKNFPVFNLEPKRSSVIYDIKYDESSNFSLLFTLTAQNWTERTGFGMDTNQGENYNKVRDLFDNTDLQKILSIDMTELSKSQICIRSNGKRMFYFWHRCYVDAKRFAEVIPELKKLHNKYFDD